MEVVEGNKSNCTCTNCGILFHKKPSEMHQNNFCTYKCYSNYRKEKSIKSGLKYKDEHGNLKDARHNIIGSRHRADIRYRMILNRTTHTTINKNLCYKDVEVNLDKEEFIRWFMANDFKGCSVDRIDKNKGYTMDNIQLIPLAENIRKDKVKERNGMCECYVCKETKPLDMFVADSRRINGHTTICKKCESIRTMDKYRKYVNENPRKRISKYIG